MISLVIATNNQQVLNDNIMRSKLARNCELVLQQGFTNIGKAYNAAITKGDIVIYAHQDVFFPDSFEEELLKSVDKLKNENWGVLGVAGVVYDKVKGVKKNIGHVMDRGKEWGNEKGLPKECETLDELLLITKGDLLFDEEIPSAIDFYGADLCLYARSQGKKVFAIDAFCWHNSTNSKLNEPFWKAAEYMKKKWKRNLPFATTCAIIS